MRIGSVWLLLGVAALGGVNAVCLTSATAGSRVAQTSSSPGDVVLREIDRIKGESRQALEAFLRREPTPTTCKVGFQLGRQRPFLVALAAKAEQAGLRRGDLLKSLAGIPITGADDVARATAGQSAGSAIDVVVDRKGQEITLPTHCAPEPQAWAAITRALEAAVNGDWETCQAAALDIARARGFVTSNALGRRADCAIAQTALREQRQSGLPLARIVYEWQQAEIREKSYEPDGLDGLRSRVLATVAVLRREGFAELANDLEEQLRTAAQRAAQEE
jgi:hypothetical protein